MPYKGLHNGDAKPPQSVPEKTTVECPECGDAMHIVKSHERETGAFVSRHFRHNRDDGHGGGGGGGRSCGESDEHIKLKSIAASKLEHIFEDNCWKCELEYTFGNTATDADHRQADALLLFDDLDEQLGQGVAVEVQYKNDSKDKHAVEKDYIENNISTVWVTPEDFGDHDMRLNEADIRDRARRAVWPEQVPGRREWWQPPHSPGHLRWVHNVAGFERRGSYDTRHNANGRDVSVPATFPEPLVDTIRYRESDWSALFTDYPERHFRLQASIPTVDRGGRSTTFQKAWWFPRSQGEYWAETQWSDRFRNEKAESTQDYIDEVAESLDRPQRTATVSRSVILSQPMVGGRYYVNCPNCGAQSGPYSPEMSHGGRMCSCGTNFRIDTANYCAGEVLNEPTD